MTHYFLDTSALVKRYVTDEVGHAWMTSLFVPTAGDLSRAHPLRTYDAVQLACAFQARDDARTAGVPAPIFVCSDTTRITVAAAEGLAAENPHDHP